ncbi:MAG: 4-oxalocrotonate tautomerase [Acidimicrobiaceae bacterium]|nr:4-oxalocrotonate tautomerase [Acidimicrobiaceae bacterium]|tara:strand:- start:433 stop:618 length:186 start_codon:yes stop_codon:yes gene_type:complete
MPIIRVEMFPGRTVDQKRDLVRDLTDGFVRACGGAGDRLHGVITEVEREDWGVGGELMSDE